MQRRARSALRPTPVKGIELRLTILQPLRAKGGGIGAGSNKARYVGDDGKLMTVLARQRPAGRPQRHAVIRAGPSG